MYWEEICVLKEKKKIKPKNEQLTPKSNVCVCVCVCVYTTKEHVYNVLVNYNH